MARNQGSIPLQGPYPEPIGPQLSLVGGTDVGANQGNISEEDGALKIEHDDGSVTIDFDSKGDEPNPEVDSSKHTTNLALKLADDELGELASNLIEGINNDIRSREDWMQTRTLGIKLLGIKLQAPRSDLGGQSAPLEGMSTIQHPILLDATISFQARARAELLPASGPVKVRNDSSIPPKEAVFQGTNAAEQLRESFQGKDEIATALERDLNHYLTVTATEYIPDTDRMLFYIGFGGDGFKKVYNCPLRRRPVSESVDAEDLIVSNSATDLKNCGRVTHRIKMRPSVLRRMQILGIYRDVDLQEPAPRVLDVVEQKKAEIAGQMPDQQRPEDRDYEIYECYCELDLDEFAPRKFKGKGLPLPYRVTIEKNSQQILDIRRNWSEGDEQCMAKQFFVQFPFVRGLGFYGLGFVHILGNTASALTAAWRMILDSGMFANFPGFIYAKGAGRQLTNQFRVGPGGGVPFDNGTADDIRKAVMPLPYKEASPAFSSFITHIEEVGTKLAATGNVAVGEGKQDAPVGTTLALIEQATKVMDSAHKRLHAAQAEEFGLLKERFREDPEALWRFNKRPATDWQKETLLKALNDCDLVPVADPNNPTSLHRIAKATAVKELQKASPDLYDPIAVDMRLLRMADIDPNGLFRTQPAAPAPDPRLVAIQQKNAQVEKQQQIDLLEAQLKSQNAMLQMEDHNRDRASREKIAASNLELQKLKIVQANVIHQADEEKDRIRMLHELNAKAQVAIHGTRMDYAKIMNDMEISRQQAAAKRDMDMHGAAHRAAIDQQSFASAAAMQEADRERAAELHRSKMEKQNQLHEQRMRHADEMAKSRVAAVAEAKPKKPKKD